MVSSPPGCVLLSLNPPSSGVMTLTLWVGSRMALDGELGLSFLVAFINLALVMANGLGQVTLCFEDQLSDAHELLFCR